MVGPTSPATRPPQLHYSPDPPAWHSRARVRRRLFYGAALAFALSAVWWGPPLWQRATLLYWQRECVNYNPPPERVVYEEEPASAEALLRSDPRYVPFRRPGGTDGRGPIAAHFPRCYEELYRRLAPMWGQPRAVLFLHERRTPPGARRLVAVVLRESIGWGGRPGLWPEVILCEPSVPGGPQDRNGGWIGGTAGGHLLDPGFEADDRPLRYYAGQADPADPSHFTIGYALGDLPGTIDGWLVHDPKHDDPGRVTVRFRVRDGPATRPVSPTPPFPE